MLELILIRWLHWSLPRFLIRLLLMVLIWLLTTMIALLRYGGIRLKL